MAHIIKETGRILFCNHGVVLVNDYTAAHVQIMDKHQDGHRSDNIATLGCHCAWPSCSAHRFLRLVRIKLHESALHNSCLAWRISWACAIVLRCGCRWCAALSVAQPGPKPHSVRLLRIPKKVGPSICPSGFSLTHSCPHPHRRGLVCCPIAERPCLRALLLAWASSIVPSLHKPLFFSAIPSLIPSR